ncbi:MAG TPA: c-type cytochrome [Kofleriaceae bacterium]|nr:c-type cytochrome [Kofleriaceae bacterium]
MRLPLLVVLIGAACGNETDPAVPPAPAPAGDAATVQAPKPADPPIAAAPPDAAAPDAAIAMTNPKDPPVTDPPVKDPPVKDPPVKDPPVKDPPVKDPITPANSGPMKDLQVLSKKMTRKEVEAYMKNDVAKALGVKCAYCHVKDDFAAPTEHKTIARDMMKMTNDISKSFFDGKPRVTCFTCHQGKAEL